MSRDGDGLQVFPFRKYRSPFFDFNFNFNFYDPYNFSNS